MFDHFCLRKGSLARTATGGWFTRALSRGLTVFPQVPPAAVSCQPTPGRTLSSRNPRELMFDTYGMLKVRGKKEPMECSTQPDLRGRPRLAPAPPLNRRIAPYPHLHPVVLHQGSSNLALLPPPSRWDAPRLLSIAAIPSHDSRPPPYLGGDLVFPYCLPSPSLGPYSGSLRAGPCASSKLALPCSAPLRLTPGPSGLPLWRSFRIVVSQSCGEETNAPERGTT